VGLEVDYLLTRHRYHDAQHAVGRGVLRADVENHQLAAEFFGLFGQGNVDVWLHTSSPSAAAARRTSSKYLA